MRTKRNRIRRRRVRRAQCALYGREQSLSPSAFSRAADTVAAIYVERLCRTVLARPVAGMRARVSWAHANRPWPTRLLRQRRLGIVVVRPLIPGGRCSQGGVKVPTGGKGEQAQARERLPRKRKGQQIRCESEADGIVRMKENGRDSRTPWGASFRMP